MIAYSDEFGRQFQRDVSPLLHNVLYVALKMSYYAVEAIRCPSHDELAPGAERAAMARGDVRVPKPRTAGEVAGRLPQFGTTSRSARVA